MRNCPREQVTTGKAMTEMSAEARLRMLRRIFWTRAAGSCEQALITGELYDAFEYFNTPKPKIDWSRDPLELPVVRAAWRARQLAASGQIDFMLDAIGVEVKDALATLNQTLKDADTLVKRVDAQWVPEGTKTLEELHRAIADADRALKNADSALFAKDSPAPQDLRDTLQEVTRAARAVRVFVDYLERHPDALIRGKPGEK